MSIRFSLGKALRHRESCTSLVCLFMPISYVSYVGIRKLVVQIFIKDLILMGYWMAGQVRTMMSSVMYKCRTHLDRVLQNKIILSKKLLDYIVLFKMCIYPLLRPFTSFVGGGSQYYVFLLARSLIFRRDVFLDQYIANCHN